MYLLPPGEVNGSIIKVVHYCSPIPQIMVSDCWLFSSTVISQGYLPSVSTSKNSYTIHMHCIPSLALTSLQQLKPLQLVYMCNQC
jgi:hypothetical protein